MKVQVNYIKQADADYQNYLLSKQMISKVEQYEIPLGSTYEAIMQDLKTLKGYINRIDKWCKPENTLGYIITNEHNQVIYSQGNFDVQEVAALYKRLYN